MNVLHMFSKTPHNLFLHPITYVSIIFSESSQLQKTVTEQLCCIQQSSTCTCGAKVKSLDDSNVPITLIIEILNHAYNTNQLFRLHQGILWFDDIPTSQSGDIPSKA